MTGRFAGGSIAEAARNACIAVLSGVSGLLRPGDHPLGTGSCQAGVSTLKGSRLSERASSILAMENPMTIEPRLKPS